MHIFVLQHMLKCSLYTIAMEQLGVKIAGKNTRQMAMNYHTALLYYSVNG